MGRKTSSHEKKNTISNESSSFISHEKKNIISNDSSFIDTVFSWSLEDILNENLYENQVEKIPDSFQSVKHYAGSYIFPLLEETRADLCSAMELISRAPFAEVITFDKSNPYGTSLYDVKVDYWRNRLSDCGKEPYRILPGDIFILADAKPESDTDLERLGRTWTFALVNYISEDESEDDSTTTYFKVKVEKDFEVKDRMWKSMFFLINVTTNKRIWNALHMNGNLKIIKEVLYTHPVVDENCNLCLQNNDIWAENSVAALSSELNKSQTNAVVASLCKIHCDHKSSVELIWGPPGTGKTKAVSSLLVTLLGMNLRVLTCAPTNVAITEVASRVLKLLKESIGRDSGIDAFLGDILLFGNKDRLKVGSDIEEIYLDYRVGKLIECFAPLTGWKHCFSSMIDLLENCVSQYQIFLENELIKEKECSCEIEGKRVDCKSFLEYVRDRFGCTASPLRSCVFTLRTHLPRSYILEDNFENMVILIHLLDSFGTMLFQDNVVPKEFEDHFSCPKAVEDSSESFSDTSSALYAKRSECLVVLKDLRSSFDKIYLPSAMNEHSIMEFCYQRASLIFCTASSSYKLHSVDMEPLNCLVIDEAAQLKECETFIPLKLQGIRRAILFGDERQLPAMVNSNVSAEAGFGRSLFERLSSMGHSKHLLNIQYRMHPSISFFPNSKFYHGKILDAANVKSIVYEKHYLPGPMFSPYSFINIFDGREEKDDVGHSLKNQIEVAVVMKILHNLHKAWNGSKEKLTVGVISPYAAQVMAIQEKLGQKYENTEGFAVKVKSVDGCQGGEEDIMIISTVRSNSGGSIGFVSNAQRTNVALTRARHCLWILGNERTLAKSDSVWEALVCDARARNCFFNADDDKDLAKTILEVKKELNQFDDLFNRDSILFRNARWKVLFSDDFRKSFGKLKSLQKKKSIINLLLKLSSGWRPKKRNVDIECESSSQILKQFKVEGLYIVCTVDIVKESRYIQVLRVWDILPLEDIPKLVKRLDGISRMYTDDFINHCKEKFLEGDLEVPKSWIISSDIVRFKNLSNNEPGSPSNAGSFDGRSYVENSKVSESLLLMKFYSLPTGVVNHLLSDRDSRELDLPFEVTDEELEIILFNRSSFILGRSGTGKTTVLTMKLFQKEQHHHFATEGFYGVNRNTSVNVSRINEVGKGIEETKESILRQLFVTVSPKLCYAVKQHVSHLKIFAHGLNSSAGSSSIDIDDIDDTAQFTDIPDTLVDIPPQSYPLVITFQKFLIMLDGTLGGSYFERFHDLRDLSQGKTGTFRSVALQTFIRTKKVNYDRFSSSYWPHFNAKLTKKLDSSRVFTEIMSHIKGGLRAGESHDGKLNQEDYVLLSEGRTSTLSKQKREIIYGIFQDYEKLKIENGEFDLADLVIDLHRRLRDGYVGDEMDFVYIDEVQDLTMRQIALFKNVCRNVREGFVFSGDTAQTISRGIDFRFQDIRSLFYNEFMLGSRGYGNDGKKEKGQISEIFNLSQNFRSHAGVLKLAQSVIDLLYRFFPQSVDVLKPETSLIYGEAPVLLESGNDNNVIVTIFGNGGNVGGNIVGFGAEQVILVRDDCTRNKILDYVGKQALVLTIVECKGLEFQGLTLAQAMQVASSLEEWKSRGIKLLQENNYVMATMCFERAGDTYWENVSKAVSLKASADRMHSLNPEKACMDHRQAAEIFESIGRADKAAECFFQLEEYETAGKLYLEKCGESKLAMAGDCFCRAECYELAANVYARGNFFSECLSVCARGKLFDMGLKYIQYWKQHATTDKSMVETSTEIDRIEQDFLESCARHYHELKDNRVMMDFVRAFHSMDKKRNFLKTLGCLNELLLLEIESGNYLVAADIAKLRGNLLLEAELLAKAGRYKEASELILWCVFSNSLWSPGSKGWPLKQFTQKEELLTKAKAYAKNVSELFYDTVCTEADVLSNEQSSLLELRQYLSASQRHESLRGEILSARKIIDAHIHSNTSKYEWEDELVVDLMQHSEDRISQNHVSVETLVYFWNFWKDKIVNILKCLECLETQDDEEYRSYGKFCLNYFGVWKPFNNLNTVYTLLISDANWVKEVNNIFLRRNGELISIDVCKFVSVARSYWCSELRSVGISLLENLEALFKFSTKNSLAMFCQSMPLIHIFDVTTFLLESKFLECRYSNDKTLQKFLELPTDYFFGYVFPLDWQKSLTQNMICLRGTELSQNLLQKVIFEIVSQKSDLTYGPIGRVLMMILGSCKPSLELYEKIAKSFEGKPLWKAFFENLCGNIGSESQVSAPSNSNAESGAGPLVFNFLGALEDTFNVNWRYENDYISPFCFLYLVERLLILVFYYQGYFFTTKSSFVEWLFYQEWDTNPTSNLTADIPFILGRMAGIVERFLYGTTDTIDWIKESNVNLNYYPLLVLRLVVILCLICVNSGIYDLLFRLLYRSYITSILPREFFHALRRIQRYNDISVNVKIIAEAFKKIENPLVMASMGKHRSEFLCSDSIFVDMKVNKCREDILRMLFPKKVQASQCHKGAVDLATTDSCSRLASNSNNQENKIPKQHLSSNFASTAEQEDSNTLIETEGNPQMTCRNFWEIFNASKSVVKDKEVNVRSSVPNFPMIKVEIEKYIRLITPAVTQSSQKNFFDGEDANLFEEATGILDELRQLYAALDLSEQELENNLSKIGELFKRVQLRRPRLESFLNQLSEACIAVGSQNDKEGSNIKAEENSESDKGKMKALEANVADKTSTSNNQGSGSNRRKGNYKNKKNKKGNYKETLKYMIYGIIIIFTTYLEASFGSEESEAGMGMEAPFGSEESEAGMGMDWNAFHDCMF